MCTLPSERLNIAQREAGKKNIVPGDGVGGGGVAGGRCSHKSFLPESIYGEKFEHKSP